MQLQETLTAFAVIASVLMLLWGAFTDLRHNKVPNLLIVVLILTGFTGQIATQGGWGFLLGLSGLAIGLAAFMPFYIGGGMGAGDVKLMGAIGVILGPGATLAAAGLSLVVGMVMVVVARRTSLVIRRYPVFSAAPNFFVNRNNGTYVPYAPAIATGSLIALAHSGTLSPFGLTG